MSAQAQILVVDDDTWILRMVSDLLARRGYEAIVATSGMDALAWAWHSRPLLAVVDVGMPVMDGWALASTMRQYPELQHIPIVFLVASATASAAPRGVFRPDIDACIAKPLRLDELDGLLSTMLPAPPPAAAFAQEPEPAHVVEMEAEPAIEVMEEEVRLEPMLPPPQPEGPTSITAEMAKAPRGFRGTLDQLRLPSILVVMSMDKAEGILVVRHGDHKGRLFFSNGRVVGAHLDSELRGAEAVYPMLDWRDGYFAFTPTKIDMEDEVQSTVDGLLLEAARRYDEANRDPNSGGDRL